MDKSIYLAGGCFWGVEHFFSRVNGIQSTTVGYANGLTNTTNYKLIKDTNHVETVKLTYDSNKISLEFLLKMYYLLIDPTSLNKQGNDIGTQYRVGIYYVDENDIEKIQNSIDELQRVCLEKVIIEVKPLNNFVAGEEYHQQYLNKNVDGYCHIGLDIMKLAPLFHDPSKLFFSKDIKTLKLQLDDLQFEVTQNAKTEKPFDNKFDSHFKKGIYIDITSGKPLFSSSDKYNSGCGWPAFSKPIDTLEITELVDNTLSRTRTEVKTKSSNSHLGHVFEDGPDGGLRYCINSASLQFIPFELMETLGYGEYQRLT